MTRLIHYYYNTYDPGCGCCSDTVSEYAMWENGVCIIENCPINFCYEEQDLRKYLAYLEPFDVDPDSRWF